MTDYSKWEMESLHKGITTGFEATEVYFREKTEHQDLVIFENPQFGRIMMLDGVTQTTQRDEFIYHEMLVHVPLFALDNPTDVLIIGGGDGGTLREVLKHKCVERPVMVEIDASVVDMSKEYLPTLSDGAFDDPRTELVITDGLKYVAETDRKFDAIIVDSTDPIGPGEVLFTPEFYTDCKRCLKDGGVLVTQNGVPFLQGHEVANNMKIFGSLFKEAAFYNATVPTYAFGSMTFGFATDNPNLKNVSLEVLEQRFEAAGFDTDYYLPDVHKAAFALPAYIRKLLK